MFVTTLARTTAALLSLATLSVAATLTVGQPNTDCNQAQYATIMAAVNAAKPGDTIEICPALYPEQVLITKPLTLQGIAINNVNRVLIQPAVMAPQGGAATEAVITVLNTRDVTIDNLAVDATNNGVSGCTTPVASIYFSDSSGDITHNALFGALVSDPGTCANPLPLGSGFGVQVDSSLSSPAPKNDSFRVSVTGNSIHDYTRNGILLRGAGLIADVSKNTISGIGPAIGVFQFGVFVENGPVVTVRENVITEGLCGSLSPSDCVNLRSEGVTLRAPGNGAVVERNVISQAQSGIFINGGQQDDYSGERDQEHRGSGRHRHPGVGAGSFTGSMIQGNRIANVTPVSDLGCGIFEYSGTGVSGNKLIQNDVNDAYCGVAAVEADKVVNGDYYNTLYMVLDSDSSATFPPTEP